MLDPTNLSPIAFTIPIGDGFPIYWYGILVVVGIAVGTFWASREIEKRGGDQDELYSGLLVAVVAGYFFARLTYVILEVLDGNGAQYSTIGEVMNLRAGGANILGGFIGATLAVYLYTRWRGLDLRLYADVAGPALLIAQAIGRWGNFINQELYGPPTTLPWGMPISIGNRIAPYNDTLTYPAETLFHPTFLYESILLLIGFVVLAYLARRYREEWERGVLFGVFLIWWGVGRFIVEFFRPDQPKIGSSAISYSMIAAILLTVVGIYWIFYVQGRAPALLPESGSSRRRRRRRSRVAKPKPRRSVESAGSENEA